MKPPTPRGTEGMKLLRHNRNYNLKIKGSGCINRIETV